MAKLCDDIERFILNLLEEQTQVEIQRNILAARLSCAPSQINYVLTTRFTPVQGFRVESRRGGGGFVRVIRIDRTRVEYMEELRAQFPGENLDELIERYTDHRSEEEKRAELDALVDELVRRQNRHAP